MADYKGKILVVDDNVANTQLLARILIPMGYHIHIADCGQATLNAIPHFQPDMLLLDIQLPDMDGYEVAEIILQDPTWRDLPIVFISAMDQVQNIVRGFEMGAVDYITKPFMPSEVLVRIDRHFLLMRRNQQIQDILRREKQRVEAISQMREQFMHAATHDLKNPLQQIMGFTTLLQEDLQLKGDPQRQQFLNYIQTSAEKMQILITDMLDLAQLETTISLTKRAVNFNKFILSTLRNFEYTAQNKGLDLAWQPLAPDNLEVRLDQNRMTRVVDNLVSNALKYTPAGGVVTVATAQTDRYAALTITDTGLGIPEEALSHLFEAFYRVNSPDVQAIPGSGLGLFIVKTIIDQHDGEIMVDSREGRGSVFTIWLPL